MTNKVKNLSMGNSAVGMLLVAIAALSWSTAGLFTRVVTTNIPTTLFWRSVFGGLAVVVIYVLHNRPKHPSSLLSFTRGEIVLAFVSGIAMCFFIAAFFFTSIANVSFVYGTSPLVTVMLAWILLKDKPQAMTLMAAGLGGVGVAVLAWGGQNFNDVVGLVLAGMMTLLMASIAVLAKYFPDSDAGKAAYLSAVIAALAMLPFVSVFMLDAHNLIWLALYGVVNIGLGFGVYLLGVARVTPATAALIGLLEVPLAPIWANLIFDEALTMAIVIGGGLVITAAIIHIRSTHRKMG